MFFPKLRRKAKWVFAFLALSFGLAFVVAGVGSGFGSGLGDYLSDLFNTQPGQDQPSVGEARDAVRENPDNPEAQQDLATALQAENDIAGAIAAMEKYVELRPEDLDGLQQLAGLYAVQASEAEERAEAAQAAGAAAFFANEIYDPATQLGPAFTGDPITTYRQEQASKAFQDASLAIQASYAKELELWKKITELEPEEANFQAQLARTAEQTGDAQTAIAAYEKFLELSPDSPQAEQIRERIDQLKEQQQAPPAGGGE
jgi:tetratricopeptide (TPR) repeat protein